MTESFRVVNSSKAGIHSAESYILVRNMTSFLRVLGVEPTWSLVTATASEDHGRIEVCPDRRRLVEAALRLGAELQTEPRVERDSAGREFVRVCAIKRTASESVEAFQSLNRELFTKFFDIYDSLGDQTDRPADEMRELYGALAMDADGGEVYLSDGVWLSSDGSLSDRGR